VPDHYKLPLPALLPTHLTMIDSTSTRVPNMQLEKMKQARGLGLNLSFVAGEERVPDSERRAVQTPRVFYRRESEGRPLIVAKR